MEYQPDAPLKLNQNGKALPPLEGERLTRLLRQLTYDKIALDLAIERFNTLAAEAYQDIESSLHKLNAGIDELHQMREHFEEVCSDADRQRWQDLSTGDIEVPPFERIQPPDADLLGQLYDTFFLPP